jgi:hypothetical protein
MNKTRRDWSSLYKCYKGKRDSLTAFYSLASAIIIIAMSFYCSIYYIGIKYPSVETLDQREISREDDAMEEEEPAISSLSGPSTSRPSAVQSTKLAKLVINDDSDDELLTGSASNTAQDSNLIRLDS